MGETLKVKTAGRFGARYGVGIRKRLLEVEGRQMQKTACPLCGFYKVKRREAGIFVCRKCGNKFAGGAYFPVTMTGRVAEKMIAQKSFVPYMAEMISATESAKDRIPELADSGRMDAAVEEAREKMKETKVRISHEKRQKQKEILKEKIKTRKESKKDSHAKGPKVSDRLKGLIKRKKEK